MNDESRRASREVGDVAQAYDRWSATYDTDKNLTRDLDALVVRRAQLDLRSKQILELGCGTGKNTSFLAESASQVFAMDFSEGMIARAHERIVTSNVRFIKHDVRDTWPVESASVDVVVANLILEHVHDLAPVFFEARRVLRPKGQMFICELHPYRQLQGGQANFTERRSGQMVRVDAYVHTISEFVTTAIEAGFTLRTMGEWVEDDAEPSAAPRLVSFLFDARRTGVPTPRANKIQKP